MPLLRNCCFCVSLNNGGKILGVLALLGSVIGTVILGLLLANVLQQHDPDKIPEYMWQFVAFAFGVCFISIITSTMLIYGAVQRRKSYIIPYLVTDGLQCLSGLAYIPFQIYLASQQSATEEAQGAVIGGVIGIAIQVYLWLCVYSLYQKLRDEQSSSHVQVPKYGAAPPAYNPNIPYSHLG